MEIDAALARGELVQRWVRERKLEETTWLEHRVGDEDHPLPCTTKRVHRYVVYDRQTGDTVLIHDVEDEPAMPTEATITKIAMALIGAGY